MPSSQLLEAARWTLSSRRSTPRASGSASLIYSTFLGGSDAELGFAIALDSTGSAYVTGKTNSAGLATAGAYQAVLGNAPGGVNSDAFVAEDPEHRHVHESDVAAFCGHEGRGGRGGDGGDAGAGRHRELHGRQRGLDGGANQPWVQITNGSGTGRASSPRASSTRATFSADRRALSATITVSAPTTVNGSVAIPVTLTIDQSNITSTAAFGQVDTPAQNVAGVQSARLA